jgi:threonylcarbamoyladenosine tRNA methylthiotransferase MtaB
MKTFSINTLGCKVNQYESQQVRELLERLGLHKFEPSKQPDLVVVNTCCVTHTASAKSRQQIHKARKLFPNAVIVVCGCLPAVQIGESAHAIKNVQFVTKRRDLAKIFSQIVKIPHVFHSEDGNWGAPGSHSCRLEPGPNNTIKPEINSKIKHKKELCDFLPQDSFEQKLTSLTSFDGQTRAFLKVQDGCDGYCTYCIVPQTRPFVRSQPAEQVLREAQTLVRAGHREIVITGIFLGAYGQKSVRRKNWPPLLSSDRKTWGQNDKLADLLDKIAQIHNLARIRLSSLEPADVTPQLLEVFCKHSNIMPHLHLSLQSGSDAILKKMCRQYNTAQIRETIELINSRLDRPAITTDIIVGFPSETEADFEQTVNLAEDTGFAKMHIFRFSPRKGTVAAKMPDFVDVAIIKKRSEILRELDIELGRKFRRQFIDESANILIESQNGIPRGRSERYFMVNIEEIRPQTSDLRPQIKNQSCLFNNDLVKVRLVKNNKTSMTGQIFTNSENRIQRSDF